MKKVTQIITYYNEEKYIKECIESLLSQTYENIEIIAISDGSTDRGPDIVAAFDDPRIIMINNTDNHGQGYCRNQGLDIATGEYIGFFDGDDISYLNRIECLGSYLDEHPDIFCVSCESQYIDENGKLIPTDTPPINMGINRIRAEFLFGCPIACSCALFRKSLIDKYNLREILECKTAEDYRFWLQCLQYADFQNVNEKLFYYRQHLSRAKTEARNDKSKHAEWMIDTFTYAWTSRGFKVERSEMELVYYVLLLNKLLWSPWQIIRLLKFRNNVLTQLEVLKLQEANDIISSINHRIYILIPYLYPIRLIDKIIGKKDNLRRVL